MTTSWTAVHLCTGDESAVDRINAWLEEHGVGVTRCADAYEACVLALKSAAQCPALTFVGTDWLAPDDAVILNYLRETWPGTGMILYGNGAEGRVGDSSALTLSCRARGELQRILESSPERLLTRLRGEHVSRGVDVPVLPAPPESCSVPELKAVQEPEHEPEPEPNGAHRVRAAVEPSPVEPPTEPEPRPEPALAPAAELLRPPPQPFDPPRAILTREELAALLDESEA